MQRRTVQDNLFLHEVLIEPSKKVVIVEDDYGNQQSSLRKRMILTREKAYLSVRESLGKSLATHALSQMCTGDIVYCHQLLDSSVPLHAIMPWCPWGKRFIQGLIEQLGRRRSLCKSSVHPKFPKIFPLATSHELYMLLRSLSLSWPEYLAPLLTSLSFHDIVPSYELLKRSISDFSFIKHLRLRVVMDEIDPFELTRLCGLLSDFVPRLESLDLSESSAMTDFQLETLLAKLCRRSNPSDVESSAISLKHLNVSGLKQVKKAKTLYHLLLMPTLLDINFTDTLLHQCREECKRFTQILNHLKITVKEGPTREPSMDKHPWAPLHQLFFQYLFDGISNESFHAKYDAKTPAVLGKVENSLLITRLQPKQEQLKELEEALSLLFPEDFAMQQYQPQWKAVASREMHHGDDFRYFLQPVKAKPLPTSDCLPKNKENVIPILKQLQNLPIPTAKYLAVIEEDLLKAPLYERVAGRGAVERQQPHTNYSGKICPPHPRHHNRSGKQPTLDSFFSRNKK
jgi:hypothetical protein